MAKISGTLHWGIGFDRITMLDALSQESRASQSSKWWPHQGLRLMPNHVSWKTSTRERNYVGTTTNDKKIGVCKESLYRWYTCYCLKILTCSEWHKNLKKEEQLLRLWWKDHQSKHKSVETKNSLLKKSVFCLFSCVTKTHNSNFVKI